MSYISTGTINGHAFPPGFIKNYKEEVKINLEEYLGTEIFELEKLYLVCNISCEKSGAALQSTPFEMLVFVKIFVTGTVNRLKSEQNLMKFMNSTVTVEDEESFGYVTMTNEFSSRAAYLPRIISESYNTLYCHRQFLYFYKDYDDRYKSVLISPLLLCTQVTFMKHEYRKDWDAVNIYLVNIHVTLYHDEFFISDDGDAHVCLDRMKKIISEFETDDNTSNILSALEILTFVCIVVSITCLLLPFVAYILLRPLRTLPGKNNMCLVVSLLLAQALMLVQPRVYRIDDLYGVVGSVSHFFWLTYFSWLGICTLHMLRVFGGNIAQNNSNKTFMKYCIFAFGIPLVIVIATASVSLLLTNGNSYGYSTNRCFIEEKLTYIATIIAPLSCLCLNNTVMFIIVAYRLRSTPDVQKTKSDTLTFTIYVKLFILTGITWTIQIVDSFLLMSALSYISTVLNGLQGMYIFLSYVCTKRTLSLFKCFISSGNSEHKHKLRRSGTSAPTIATSRI